MNIKGIYEGISKAIKATKGGELKVHAIIEDEIEHASGAGAAFVWQSTNSDIDAGDTRLFIKNTSDMFLLLDRAIFNPANVVCSYGVGICAQTTTPAGVAVVGINMNEAFSTTTFDHVAYDDETAVVTADELFGVTVNTTQSLEVSLHGIILGKNHYVQITQLTEATSGKVSISGHFQETVE